MSSHSTQQGTSQLRPHIVVLNGNPRAGSRTSTVARAVAGRLGARLADSGTASAAAASGIEVVELADLAPDLFTDTVGLVRAALKTVASADVLVVATPAYKGHYTGLLKAFLDLLPSGALSGTVAVPVVVAASPEHRVTAAGALRAVLDELAASLPVRSFTVVEARLAELEALADAWVHAQLPVLRATVAALAPPTSSLNGTRPEHGSGSGSGSGHGSDPR